MSKPEKLLDLFALLLGLVLIAGVFLNFANAILRYGFGTSIVWAEEVMIFGLILIVMAGLIVVTARSEHLKIDLLLQILPSKMKRLLSVVAALAVAAVFAYLAWLSLGVVQLMYRLGQTSVAARIPMWIPHGFLFASFALASLAALYRAWLDLRQPVRSAVEDYANLRAEGEVQ
jgi:TRAP-type C4-dicarboxylate transport system permease small subunit